MDFINKMTSEAGQQLGQNQDHPQQQQQTGANPPPAASQHEEKVASGFMGSFGGIGGIGDKLNAAAGGGKESEKNEDLLDKGVDMFQQRVLNEGPQNNESALEQAKDEEISDIIRAKYKGVTGSDFPIKDKPTTFG